MPLTSTIISNSVFDVEINNIKQFTGNIYYVDGASGDDSNDGVSPKTAFSTINYAIDQCIKGDGISIKAATYVENVVLDIDAVELWFEIGSIIAPSSGDALTISGNYCRVTCEGGVLRINNNVGANVGVSATGNWVYLNEIRVFCNSVGATGFDIQGSGCDARNCRCSNPISAAYKISGDSNKLENCCTGGEVANNSIGYWMTNSCDKFRLIKCGSQGHADGGFYVDSGCTNGVIWQFTSGGGDGKCIDEDSNTVISDLTYPETKYKEITLNGSGSYNLFEIIGSVEIKRLFGHATTTLVGANTDCYFQLFSTNGSDNISKTTGTDLGTASVGTLIIKDDDSGKNLSVLVANQPRVDKVADPKKEGVFVQADIAATTYLQWVCDGGDDAGGVLHFHIVWEPLTDDAFVKIV